MIIPVENNYRISNCPFCNSTDLKKMGNLTYAGNVEFSTHIIDLAFIPEVWSCKNCRSSFTQNAIHPAKAEELYETGEGSKRWTSKNFIADKTKAVIDCLNKYMAGKNIKVLDVGCNTGEFLDYAMKGGAQTFGLELCEQSCKIISSKGHTAFRTGNEIKESFDLITAFDLFEHLYDPIGFLTFIHEILKEGGLFILLTGNPESLPARLSKENWWYFNYPEHVIFPVPSFFNNLKNFRVIETVNVFASITHEEKGIIAGLKNIGKVLLSRKYNGRPAIIPDHQLVVLQKI